jgi:hypothetical protein
VQLASLGALLPLVAVGATGWALGTALPERPGRRVRRLGATLVAACLVVGGLWAAFVGTGVVLDAHPELAPAVLVALLLVLLLIPLVRGDDGLVRPTVRAADREDGDDPSGGGGGLRRPRPAEPRGPGPGSPPVAWDEFDELRRGWERAPAGTR